MSPPAAEPAKAVPRNIADCSRTAKPPAWTGAAKAAVAPSTAPARSPNPSLRETASFPAISPPPDRIDSTDSINKCSLLPVLYWQQRPERKELRPNTVDRNQHSELRPIVYLTSYCAISL